MNNTLKKILFIISMISIGTGIYFFTMQPEGIYPYERSRDRRNILNFFSNNWYWLVSSPDFSPEYMLDIRAIGHSSDPTQNLTLFVYRKNKKFIGFVAYGLKNKVHPKVGYVLFLAVDTPYRKKGYAKKLLQYACTELIKQGVKQIELVTRTENYAAQRVYTSLGFTEIARDLSYVDYVLTIT